MKVVCEFGATCVRSEAESTRKSVASWWRFIRRCPVSTIFSETCSSVASFPETLTVHLRIMSVDRGLDGGGRGGYRATIRQRGRRLRMNCRQKQVSIRPAVESTLHHSAKELCRPLIDAAVQTCTRIGMSSPFIHWLLWSTTPALPLIFEIVAALPAILWRQFPKPFGVPDAWPDRRDGECDPTRVDFRTHYGRSRLELCRAAPDLRCVLSEPARAHLFVENLKQYPLTRDLVHDKILFFAIQPQAPLPLCGCWCVLSMQTVRDGIQ